MIAVIYFMKNWINFFRNQTGFLKHKITLLYLLSFLFIRFITRCHLLSLIFIFCYSLWFSVIRCHSLSLVVICSYSLYHSLSLVVILCHSLSLLSLVVPVVVTRCTTCLSFYKRSTDTDNYINFLSTIKKEKKKKDRLTY